MLEPQRAVIHDHAEFETEIKFPQIACMTEQQRIRPIYLSLSMAEIDANLQSQTMVTLRIANRK
jgi:hypothetical protein